ncbi:alpha-1,6-mannosyltransferase [Pichia californica]|nr:alpha-1,6-mannosyltransferase [[Candida] californica]
MSNDYEKSIDPMDISDEYYNKKNMPFSLNKYSKIMKPNNKLKFNFFNSKTYLKFEKNNVFIKFKKILKYLLLIPIIFFLLSLIKLNFFQKNLNNSKIVIILAVNQGGGVERWKTPQEWSVERSSIANKKDYAERHGYILTLKDTTLKRRYSHEWREGWEKADILRQTMREFPNAEWFWWLDTHTFIMEPELSLESYLLNNIDKNAYRSVNHFNPMKIKSDIPYVTTVNQPVDMILAQDCGGFNLGSFLIRRSEWSELLLDIWWDPVYYEQMHMFWEHKEQDCLENLYNDLPWIRERLGFVPLKSINSFPKGACEEQKNDPRYFYNKNDRDFIVNMAGCNYGDRSCWDEYEYYRNLKMKLHRPWYQFWS